MAAGSEARKPVGQQTVYHRLRLLGASGVGTRSIGFIPAGSNIVRVLSSTRVAFNGAATMTVGSRAAPANLVATGGAGLAALGHTNQAIAVGLGSVVDVDTELVAVIGGAPTLGVSDIQIEYIPPDERPA